MDGFRVLAFFHFQISLVTYFLKSKNVRIEVTRDLRLDQVRMPLSNNEWIDCLDIFTGSLVATPATSARYLEHE